MMMWDYVIIGAGAAGAVLASRLSENPAVKVLLIEAGRDLPPDRLPADVASLFPLATFNERYMWPDLRAHWRTASNSPALAFQQGRVMGGSATVMGMWALRGMPGDYDGWAASGAEGWAWDDVLPYFRKLETDCDFAGPLHGADGPIPIRRQDRRDWSALAGAVHAVAGRLGLPDIADMNGDFRDGHCALPISRYQRSRASAAICYLTADIRRRPNLHIVTDTMVIGLLRDGPLVTGVRARRRGGGAEDWTAGETIITAGALQTPALLMRAGIGPAAHLQAMGITVAADRPGVGRNLQNHPLLPGLAMMRAGHAETSRDRPPAGTFLRWSSGVPGSSAGDMGLYVRGYLVWHALGRRMAMLAPVLMKPHATGEVRLSTPSPEANPVVTFNFLDHPDDLRRMMAGFRRAAEIFAAAELRAMCGPPFALTEAGRLARYNTLSAGNAVLAWAAAKLFDLSARGGMGLLGLLAQVRKLHEFVADDDALADFVTTNVIGTNHVCGTSRIGRADDPMAVVDPAGAVRGIAGLRVADASVMPAVPSGNTHIPTVMVAEKIAAAIGAGR